MDVSVARELPVTSGPVDDPQAPVLAVAGLAGGDERERTRLADLLEHGAHASASLVPDEPERRGLEDDRQRVSRLCGHHLGQSLDVVALDELRRILAQRLDRAVEPAHPFVLARPDERAQEPCAVLWRNVD